MSKEWISAETLAKTEATRKAKEWMLSARSSTQANRTQQDYKIKEAKGESRKWNGVSERIRETLNIESLASEAEEAAK